MVGSEVYIKAIEIRVGVTLVPGPEGQPVAANAGSAAALDLGNGGFASIHCRVDGYRLLSEMKEEERANYLNMLKVFEQMARRRVLAEEAAASSAGGFGGGRRLID